MTQHRVMCPSCGAMLSLDGESRVTQARCQDCGQEFGLPRRMAVPDDTIVGWLADEPPHEFLVADDSPPIGYARAAATASAVAERPRLRAKLLTLVRLDNQGVLLEFPADYLFREDFRAAMPRVCVHCLSRQHLAVHLVVFGSILRDSIGQESVFGRQEMAIAEEHLSAFTGGDLLERLPELPGLASPANLPMPYWVCRQCDGVDEIAAQMVIPAQHAKPLGRLLVHNAQVAMAFFASSGGEGSADYARLREFVRQRPENRWELLPTLVRRRLEAWFRPKAAEMFLAFVPDRRFSYLEDGEHGLVISDRRLLCRCRGEQAVWPVGTPLKAVLRDDEGRYRLRLHATGESGPEILLDHDGLRLFRRAVQGWRQIAW